MVHCLRISSGIDSPASRLIPTKSLKVTRWQRNDCPQCYSYPRSWCFKITCQVTWFIFSWAGERGAMRLTDLAWGLDSGPETTLPRSFTAVCTSDDN
jgi:hypothetical protein